MKHEYTANVNLMQQQHGFTLIELLVTVAIIGLLATLAVPLLSIDQRRNREFELQQDLRTIRQALDAYKDAVDQKQVMTRAGSSGYPPDLKTLVNGVLDQTDPNGKKKIYFLRRIPRDPMCECPDKAADETWQLRSYASPPNDPQPGDDVYDVTSRSHQKGLNGVPYNQW